MRENLRQINGHRDTFRGTFVRLGRKSRYKAKKVGDEWVDFDTTVLLSDIVDKSGNAVCDHLWLNLTKGFEALGELHEGDEITFNGRVKPYLKGYIHSRDEDFQELDYKLSHPSKVKRTKVAETSPNVSDTLNIPSILPSPPQPVRGPLDKYLETK